MRIDSRASSACLLFIVAAFSLAPVAHADLYSAKAAYEKKDHARAFALFRELAELGQPLAQESLAIMYVLGEGVKRDNVAGYAWARLLDHTLSVYTLTITDSGGYEMHVYDRALDGDTMDLRFTRLEDGSVVRLVSGRLRRQ